jgi:hypothetical protein
MQTYRPSEIYNSKGLLVLSDNPKKMETLVTWFIVGTVAIIAMPLFLIFKH